MNGQPSPHSTTLLDYCAEVASFPPPTADQIRDFVEFAAEAHSWYKHLPCFKFTSFSFFLNPVAGMDCKRTPDGQIVFEARTAGSHRFHYTWMTTADYRRRFGILDYFAAAGTSFLVGSGGSVIHVGLRSRPLPPEIIEAGQVGWTAAIHRRSRLPHLWLRDSLELNTEPDWPEASGGPPVARQILAILDTYDSENLEWGKVHEPTMECLLLPERQRQKRSAEDAIRRVASLTYPA